VTQEEASKKIQRKKQTLKLIQLQHTINASLAEREHLLNNYFPVKKSERREKEREKSICALLRKVMTTYRKVQGPSWKWREDHLTWDSLDGISLCTSF
jgi:hypothetical protein